MKKRIYFILTSIIGIIWSIVSLVTLNITEVIQEQTEFFNEIFDNNIPENILQIINNTSQYYIEIIIGIILFGVILLIAIKNNIVKNKTTLIILSILIFIFASNPGLIGILNILVLLTIKKDKNNTEKKKETFEKLDEPSREKWDIIEAIFIIVSYFGFLFGLPILIAILYPDFEFTEKFTLILNIVLDIVLFIVTFTIFYKELKKQIVIFFQKIKPYLKFILKSYVVLLLINFVSNLIIMVIKGDMVESANQQSLSEFPILYLIFGTIIFAPVVEELVFRGSIRRIIKNDTLFMIISALTFGLLHTIGQEANLFDTILMALPYMGMGFILARTYVKTNNLCCNITMHALHNTFATIIMITSIL